MTETNITPRVLFLCTHNAARSQRGEAFLGHDAGDRSEALSSGLAPTHVHPLTCQVLTETGLDPRARYAKDLYAFLGKVHIHSAIFVCDQEEAHGPRLSPFALHTLSWPCDDPTQAAGSTEERLRIFRTVRDQIAHGVRVWLFTLEDSL